MVRQLKELGIGVPMISFKGQVSLEFSELYCSGFYEAFQQHLESEEIDFLVLHNWGVAKVCTKFAPEDAECIVVENLDTSDQVHRTQSLTVDRQNCRAVIASSSNQYLFEWGETSAALDYQVVVDLKAVQSLKKLYRAIRDAQISMHKFVGGDFDKSHRNHAITLLKIAGVYGKQLYNDLGADSHPPAASHFCSVCKFISLFSDAVLSELEALAGMHPASISLVLDALSETLAVNYVDSQVHVMEGV
jgi:hypothetical protein